MGALFWKGGLLTALTATYRARMPLPALENAMHTKTHTDLGGVLDMAGELNRYAVARATRRDAAAVRRCRDVADALMGRMLRLDLRNGALRKKFDGLKYTLRRMEQTLYELSLADAHVRAFEAAGARAGDGGNGGGGNGGGDGGDGGMDGPNMVRFWICWGWGERLGFGRGCAIPPPRFANLLIASHLTSPCTFLTTGRGRDLSGVAARLQNELSPLFCNAIQLVDWMAVLAPPVPRRRRRVRGARRSSVRRPRRLRRSTALVSPF